MPGLANSAACAVSRDRSRPGSSVRPTATAGHLTAVQGRGTPGGARQEFEGFQATGRPPPGVTPEKLGSHRGRGGPGAHRRPPSARPIFFSEFWRYPADYFFRNPAVLGLSPSPAAPRQPRSITEIRPCGTKL